MFQLTQEEEKRLEDARIKRILNSGASFGKDRFYWEAARELLISKIPGLEMPHCDEIEQYLKEEGLFND